MKIKPTYTIELARTHVIRGVLLIALSISCSLSLAGDWNYKKGKGYTLCDAMLKRLNSISDLVEAGSSPVCNRAGALSLPGISEPSWTELNAEEHQDLIFKLMAYSWAGGKRNDVDPKLGDVLRDRVRQFIQSGGRVQLWRTHLLNDFYNRSHPETWAPSGLQNVVQLRYSERDDQAAERAQKCSMIRDPVWSGSVFIANDTLTDVHSDIGAAGFLLMRGILIIYKGRPYIVAGGGAELVIIRDGGTGPTSFCELERSTTNPESQTPPSISAC